MKSSDLSNINYQLRSGLANSPQDIENWKSDLINKDDGIHFNGSETFYKAYNYHNLDAILDYIADQYTELGDNKFKKLLNTNDGIELAFLITISDNYFEFGVEGTATFEQKDKVDILETQFYKLGELIGTQFAEERNQLSILFKK